MNLENQVVSLDLAKRLKKLGFKQESIFDWVEIDDNDWMLMIRKKKEFEMIDDDTKDSIVSAYTMMELGESLPEYVAISKIKGVWFVECDGIIGEKRDDHKNRCFTDNLLVEAVGQCLRYLKENNLIQLLSD